MASSEQKMGAMRAALERCRPHLVAAGGFSALVNILYIAPTIYMLQVYDRVVPTQGHLTLLFLTVALLGGLGTLALLDRIRNRLLTRAGVRLDATLAPRILDMTIARPDLPEARQALREFDAMRQTLTGPGMLALFDAPWVPIYVLVCFLVHPWLGVVALIGALILPVIAWRNERGTRPKLEAAQKAAASSYTAQDAVLGAAEAVRALGMRRAMVSRALREREQALTLQTDAGLTTGTYLSVTKFTRLALQSLALGVGALLAIDNKITGGAIFAASFLIARALQPIEQLVGTWRPIVQARGGYRSLDALLAAAGNRPQTTRLPAPDGRLNVDGLTLLAESRDRTILNGISFAVRPGEVLAIVGPSGAGKSTLARALAGAIRIDRGTIRIDGAERGDWDPEVLAAHVGYLPQDIQLIAGSIKDNVSRFAVEMDGDPVEIDRAAVTAAQTVGAHDLILRLPGGYDHVLGARGQGVSIGQAQRIALARAAYGDPAVMILDEPNAHLDAEGDGSLIAALATMKAAGRTILIVSHKLSILPVVDTILVLRDGKVDVVGPRDEVLAKIAPQTARRGPPMAAA